MLVLTRAEGQRIRIGNDIVVVVARLSASKVRLGIDAPKDVVIMRTELAELEQRNPSTKDSNR